MLLSCLFVCFFVNETATTEIYTYGHTLSLHDALPIVADYQSPTIVRPDIPRSAMTLLEHRLLIGMFSHEGAEDAVYFFAEEYVNDLLHLDLPEVHRLLGDDPFQDSYAVTVVRDHLRKLDPAEGELALDMSVIGYEGI